MFSSKPNLAQDSGNQLGSAQHRDYETTKIISEFKSPSRVVVGQEHES